MTKQLRVFLEMVRFEHSIFALPFAYLGMIMAANWPPAVWAAPVLPTFSEFFWITVAMVAARTVGFAINRYADRHFDARNPRTANRPLPTGRLSPAATLGYGGVALLVLALAAWQLNPLTLKLLPGAVFLLVLYSYTKRFTWLSHWVLGATDGLAPAGAWAGVRAQIDLPAWFLWLAVTFWIAGFDVIYACQDTQFDRQEKLHSVPARFGNATALQLARASHLLTVVFLVAVGLIMGLGLIYWLGMVVVAGLLIYEHSLISPTDLSRVNQAFFNVNGYIAVVVFIVTIGAIYIG